MNKSLFKISAEMQQITTELMENGGELTPEIENALLISKKDLQTKSVGYAVVIRSIDYENDIIDQEIKRLQSLKKSRLKVVDRLKNSLSFAMQVFGVDEIKTELSTINFRQSQSLEIIDESKIANKYKTEVITTKIDKLAIKKDIKNGDFINVIHGAELTTHQNLQIK